MEIYTVEEVPIEVVGLVAWKMPRALLRALREEILLVSLLFLSISEGLRVITMILIRRAKIAITINSSINVKLFLLKYVLKFKIIFSDNWDKNELSVLPF